MSLPVICPKNYGRCGANIQYDSNKLFVLMPFNESVAPQSLFYNVLQPLPGWTVHRADSDLSKPEIWCKICANIQESRAVIADLSGSNPNVFLELGLVWGFGKPFILLTQEIGKLPFDTRSFHVIRYERESANSALVRNAREVQDELAWALKSIPEEPGVIPVDYVLEDFNKMIEQAKERTAMYWRRADGEWRVYAEDRISELLLETKEDMSPYKVMLSLLRMYPECKRITQIASETGLHRTVVSRILAGHRYDHGHYFSACQSGYRLSDEGVYYFIEQERIGRAMFPEMND